jgi:ATP-dependent Lhr-like helicase
MIRKVEPGTVRVIDAHGAPPTVPFWLGEAPARTAELSEEVAALRRGAETALLAEGATVADVAAWLGEHCGLTGEGGTTAASLMAAYLAAAHAALGVLPTQDDVVFERFFDDTGGSQLVVHAPFGGRINRGLGLALRKKFCVTFDFELQAAATDDAVLLSLGPQHGVGLPEVATFVTPRNVEPAVRQAVLQSPFFTARWRWNLNRSLAVLRMKGGRKNPAPIQRMEADDLMVAVFPQLAACQDNAAPGPIEVPDHPLVNQTLHDCLHEAIDLDGLVGLLEGMESGAIRVHFKETTEASLLAHEVLTARPYAFLDDEGEIQNRRSQSVVLRRGIPLEDRDLTRLDPEAVARVREEAAPDPRSAEELHDLLLSLVVMRPAGEWEEWFAELVVAGRALSVDIGDGPLWCARERRGWVEAVWPGAAFEPDLSWDGAADDAALPPSLDDVTVAVVRGHLDVAGPVTLDDLSAETGLSDGQVRYALAALNNEGFALEGRFDPELGDGQWCSRRFVARMHAYTQKRRRSAVKPITQAEFEERLAGWQHTAPGSQLTGRAGLLEVVEQMQGIEMAIGSWEDEFRRRIAHYRPEWLDDLCLSGEVVWGRLSLRRSDDPDNPPRRGRATPSRATPITFMLREDVPWLLQAVRGLGAPVEPVSGAGRDVLDAPSARGALFHGELQGMTGRLPVEIEEGLWDGVARGLVTADGFQAVRSLLGSRAPAPSSTYRRRTRPRLGSRGRRGDLRAGFGEGRWSLMPTPPEPVPIDELAEAVAGQLLLRYGIVFRDVYLSERFTVPWREVVWALRRLEARGQVLGGRFVTGVTGEQYSLAAVG